MAEEGDPPVMTVQKTPRGGDQVIEFIDPFTGKFVNPVQLTPSGLIAEYLYPDADPEATAQKRPSCGDQVTSDHC